MSKKQKRKVTAHNDTMRNVVRTLHSTKNIRTGVAKARNLHANITEDLFHFLYDRPIFRGIIQNCSSPFHVEELSYLPSLHKYDAASDLLWTALFCAKHADSINLFVELRNKFENSLITADYTSSSIVLESIKEKFGYSLWYFDRKFQLLQLSEGLASQKEYLSTILENKEINPIVGYFLFMLSMKSEPNISLSYLEEIANEFDGRTIRFASFFRYMINPTSLLTSEDPYYTLYGAENGTLIDKYQLLASLFQNAAAISNRDNAPYNIEHSLQTIRDIKDEAIDTARILFQNFSVDDNIYYQRISSRVFDLYTEGKYRDSSQIALSSIIENPCNTELLEIFVRSNTFLHNPVLPEIDNNSILMQSLKCLTEILTMSSDLEQYHARLEKLYLSVNHTRFGLQLLAFTRRKHAFGGEYSYSDLDQFWAASCDYRNPWHQELLERTAPPAKYQLRFNVKKSSAFTLRRAFRDNDQTSIDKLAIPASRKIDYSGKIALREGRLEDARSAFTAGIDSPNFVAASNARKNLFVVLLAQNDLFAAMDLALQSYYLNNNFVYHYDFVRLVEGVAGLEKSTEQKVKAANIYSLAFRFFDCPLEPDISNLFEDIIRDVGCDRASIYANAYDGDKRDMIYFLTHVATIRTMEDSTMFPSLDEIDEERIAICNWLSEHDPSAYRIHSNEIRTITRHGMISKLHNQVSDSKMYVDETGITQLISLPVEDDFKRHQELLRNPDVNYNSQQIAKKMGRLFEARDTLQGDKVASDFRKWKVPANERHSLLEDIYSTFLDRFLFSPEFGLDSHISANVRHGTFVGQIRSPLAERFLVSTRNKNTSIYDDNLYWISKYEELSQEELDHINNCLKKFSARCDKLFNYINDDLLHVKNEKKESGLFDFSLLSDIVQKLGDSLNPDSQLDEFVRLLFDTAWQQASFSMESVREYLLGEMEPEILRYFSLLERDISSMLPLSKVSELADEIAKARIDINAKTRSIVQWFRPPTRADDDQFPFDIIVEVAEAEAKQCFGGRVIKVDKTVSVPGLVRGRKIFGFIEIIFILLQNAISHCGKPSPNTLTISVDDVGGRLELIVSNTLDKSVDVNERLQQAAEAVARYHQTGAVKKLRTEGGSGLSKIWRTAEYTLKTQHWAEMTIKDDVFQTRISMVSDGIFI